MSGLGSGLVILCLPCASVTRTLKKMTELRVLVLVHFRQCLLLAHYIAMDDLKLFVLPPPQALGLKVCTSTGSLKQEKSIVHINKCVA